MKRKKYLTALCLALLSACLLPMGAGAMTDTAHTVVAFGDSITASGSWFAAAERQFGIRVINRAVGGWNSKQGRASFANALAARPDILLLSFGMNDSALDMDKHVSPEEYRENMVYMIEKAIASGARVILVIENPIGEKDYYTRHEESVFEPHGGADAYNQIYVGIARELAAEYELVVADLNRIFRETGDPDRYLADGVHPNAAGYQLYAKALCDALFRLDLGDVDGDGKLDVKDYLLVKRQVLETGEIGAREPYADLDQNGRIDALDYFLLKWHILHDVRPGTATV